MSAQQKIPPDLLNYDQGAPLVIVSSVAIPFAFVVVAVRVWARHRKQMSIGIDDWFIIVSLVRVSWFSHWFYLPDWLTSRCIGVLLR
jgi:hypothetical protein